MPGIPVVITDKYGIPVRQVTSGAPLMTVATNGRGIPIVLSNRGMAFVVEGANPVVPAVFTAGMWSATGANTAINVTINSLPYNGGSVITAVQYRLNGGSWVSSGGTGSFTISGLTNGTTYTVELRAVNAIGNGLDSDDKTATPATVPSAPTLALTPADGQVTVAWTDGATGGSAITARRLYRSTSSGFTPGPGNLIATSPTFPYVDTAVTNDTTYYYKGIAANIIGDSAASTQQSATPSATVTQVTIAPNDALSRFEISNTASFPGGTWTWYDDGGTQVGTVTTSYLLYSAVPTGKLIKGRANGNAATDSILWAVEQNNAVVNIDFTGLADQALNGLQGIVADAAYQVIGGKLTVNSSDKSFYVNTGSLDQRVSYNALIRATTDTDSSSTRRGILVNATTNNSDYVMLDIRGGVIGFEKRIAYNYSNYSSNINNTQNNGDKLVGNFYWTKSGGTPVKPYIQYYQNGTRIDSGGTGMGIDINAGGQATALTPYTYAGLTGPSGTGVSNPSYPIGLMTTLKIEAIPDLGVRVFYHDFTTPTAGNPPSITFTGTTAYADIQAVVLAEDGHELGGITSFTGLTPGAMSLTIPNPPEGMLLQAFLRVRQTSNTTNYIDYPLGTLPYYDPVDTLEAGFNIGGNGSYAYGDTVQDRGKGASWRYYNPGTTAQIEIPDADKNDEGWPINVAIPSGYTERVAIFFEGNGPGIRTGPWDITADGWTCASPMVGVYLDNSGTPVMTASAATTSSIRLTQVDTNGGSQGAVRFPGAVPPAGGLKVKCLKVGETVDGNSVTPGVAAILGETPFPGKRSIRLMKTTGADGDIGGTTNPVIVNFAGTAQYAADLTYRLGAGTDIHWNTPWADIILRKSTRITPWMTAYLANARSTSILSASSANEVWNSEYRNQFGFMAAAGCNAGLMPEITIPSGVTVTAELYWPANLGGAVEAGGLTRRTINPNETFTAWVADYQWGIYQCISATPVAAGYVIPQLGDSKFARLAPYAGVATASRRMLGECQKQMAIEGRAILGDRFISTYEVWIDDSAETIRDLLMFNDTWQYVDEISPSFYAGGYTNYGDLPWHDKFTSDFAAFKAGMIAREVSTWANTLAKLVYLKHTVPRLLLEAGVPRDQLPRVRRPYEGGTHNGVKAVPSGDRAAFIAAGQTVIRSPEYAAAMGQIWIDLKAKFGGPCEWFQDIEPFWWNFGGGQMQWFGLREFQFDGAWNSSGANERRYLATRAVFGT